VHALKAKDPIVFNDDGKVIVPVSKILSSNAAEPISTSSYISLFVGF
jgi:hypothetical protein